jgi:uncharacterized membrane protein/mono/diheme cytochrome c family protein
MNAFIDFFGRFHPVLVHLPIGFLLLALVFQWLARKEKFMAIIPAIKIAFLLGMISAVLSCLSGWSLSSGGEYDETTLDYHKWMGISVAVVSIAGYWLADKPSTLFKNILSIATLVFIIITGHLGGTLTHGDGFLTKGLFGKGADSTISARKTIANVQEAVVFTDIIQPILTDKCGSCHSAKKQKGGLRLDAQEWILKGGKEGKVFVSGNPTGSELYKRALLDPLEEKHMPPKGKPQLTEQEMNLIHWWISSNGAFDKKVKDLGQPAKILPALLAMQSAATNMKKPSIPEGTVDPVSPIILDSMHNAGIIVLPVAANSNYLSANFVSIQKVTEQTVALLQLIQKQLVWLKLGYANLSDNSWKIIGQCINLTRLSIDHTNLTDTQIIHLAGLKNLQYLNLVGTKITVQGIQQLRTITTLEDLYLGQTSIKGNDFISLQKQFPKTILDSGNYHLENLVSDTQIVKAPPIKK